MSFKIFKKKIFNSFKEAEKNLGNQNIYFSKDYLSRNLIKLKKINKIKKFHEYEYTFIKFLYSILLNQNTKKTFNLLDYGGGIGNIILEIIKKKYFHKQLKVSIFDNNYNLVKEGKKFFEKKVDRKHLKNIKFLKNLSKKQNYDAIHFGSMMEYISDDDNKFFSSIFSKIKKKPTHIFFSDIYISKNNKDFFVIGKYYKKNFVVRFRNIKKLTKLMNSFGYKILDRRSFMPNIAGKYKFYDMSNLEKKYRIYNTMNLHFKYSK